MNRYGQLAMEYQRTNLPRAFSAMRDPEQFFATVGEEIAASIGTFRDQILGLRPGETAEEFRRRSSQASATAEELVLADHHLLTAAPEAGTVEPTVDDPELAAYHQDLAAANDVIQSLYE